MYSETRYLIHLGANLIRSEDQVFVGQAVRWTPGGGGYPYVTQNLIILFFATPLPFCVPVCCFALHMCAAVDSESTRLSSHQREVLCGLYQQLDTRHQILQSVIDNDRSNVHYSPASIGNDLRCSSRTNAVSKQWPRPPGNWERATALSVQ